MADWDVEMKDVTTEDRSATASICKVLWTPSVSSTSSCAMSVLPGPSSGSSICPVSRSPSAGGFYSHHAEHRTFSILYVPDPSREKNRCPGSNLAWIIRNIKRSQYAQVQHLSNVCFIAAKQLKEMEKDEVRVEITEWLWTMLCISEHMNHNQKSFDLSYMSWNDFKATICSPEENMSQWNFLLSRDCIIGGLDYTIGTRCASNIIVSVLNSSYFYSPQDGNNYDLEGHAFDSFERNIKLLRTEVHIWPPILQVQMAAAKAQTVAMLDRIAAIHGWMRPSTTLIEDGAPIPIDTVLKRSHSDAGSNVILPPIAVPDHMQDCEERRTNLSRLRTWKELKECTTSSNQSWMSQEYVPTLRQLGEWRFFLVGGKIANVVHTYHDFDTCKWCGEFVTSFYTKNEIRDIWARHGQGELAISEDTFVNPTRGDLALREKGKREVYEFVDIVFRDLAVRENQIHGTRNSISVFCRIDVGLLFDRAGEPWYFVNEIERTTTASLWLRMDKINEQRSMMDTFARVFHSYLTSLFDPHLF
ncbi:hypothetical protein JVU11DRAFT_11559 [Chiua virens]|nr:hypothetical protein JVU11DRAFT_11559 [Chiua virens]